MSVRQGLLAILNQGPCYGYQLRTEFDRRTGSTWPLNVGQIYNTLDRLERDGLVSKADIDEQGHVYWKITDAGSVAVDNWLGDPVRRSGGTRDELAIKLALAATLPGVDVMALIESQRQVSRTQFDELLRTSHEGATPDEPQALTRSLVIDSMICAAEAELRWLDRAEQRLAQHPERSMAFELSDERPKRGRPARATAH
ncbi:PadR family transcriptional regulator [Microbacterium sp. NPDC076911]|uniref:PadR family transcriptional regulator n=1 Tax=Microbacterium sp. NPDC076911 TaxID=3154958 RepID=UPI003417FF5C